MRSKEWLAYLGQKTNEQMVALCALYGEHEAEHGETYSIPTLLSFLMIEGVQPEIVVHYFRKKSHTARIVYYDNFSLVMVSQDPVPADLLRRTKQLNKQLFTLKQQQTMDQERKIMLEEELGAVTKQLNALPMHVKLWSSMTVADE